MSQYVFLTKYINGGELETHIDGNIYENNKKSSYTIIIYLNEDFEGGRTIFVDNNEGILTKNSIFIKPKVGSILILDQNKYKFYLI